MADLKEGQQIVLQQEGCAIGNTPTWREFIHGCWRWLTLIVALDVSLAVLGSVTLPVTVAVLLMVVPTDAFDTFTTTLIEARPELAMVPKPQVPVVVPVQVSCGDLALTTVVPVSR